MKRKTKQGTRRVRVADEVQVRGCRVHVVTVEGRSLALWEVDGKLVCIDDRCPHAGGRLSEGQISGAEVRCPRHGWRFDVVDGHCLTDPRFEVRRFAVEVENGAIWVEVPIDW